jgi:proteic killer suppression protein
MIASFGDKATESLFHEGTAKGALPNQITTVALRKLDMLNAATQLNDLRAPPGNRLEALKGDYAGYHSIRINDQWRIVFRWEGADAHEVRIVDYHS